MNPRGSATDDARHDAYTDRSPTWIQVGAEDAWFRAAQAVTLVHPDPWRGGDVDKIGVLLVEGQLGMLSDIVRDVLEADPNIDLLGQVTDIADTVDAVERSQCDAVLWMLPDAGQAVAPADVLRHHPALRIVAVEGRGQHGSLWRMRPQRTLLGQLSPERIIAELRGVP